MNDHFFCQLLVWQKDTLLRLAREVNADDVPYIEIRETTLIGGIMISVRL